MNTREKVIKIYETHLTHPSYMYIALKVGVSKTRVAQILEQYKKIKRKTK